MAQLEWDIVQEVFCPFNCRSLLIDLLSTDRIYRDHDEPKVYREIITRLWPEVLSEPINPGANRIRAAVTKALRRLAHKKKLGRWWWWIWMAMHLSHLPCLGPFFAWLAGLPLGPYKEKQSLAQVTSRPYISPKAEISACGVQIGPQCFIDDFVTIGSGRNGGSVTLDERVHVYRGTVIEANRGTRIIIGADTHVEANCVLNSLVGNVRIGRDVQIAPHCGFFSGQRGHNDRSQPKYVEGPVSRGDIVIEDGVQLGMGVVVYDGVCIGRGAIVGAGTVVTEDVSPYSIVTGRPAHAIRQEVSLTGSPRQGKSR
jgi:acetyltransferase-like isoleucine patch superfamily enzyme